MSLTSLAASGLLFGWASACAGPDPADDPNGASLYALVQGIDGVYFYPPLGPEPAPQGAFDATLLDGISVAIEAVDPTGQVTPLATFDQSTHPAVALLGPAERYFVNIPAAAYVTDPSKTYRIRVALDGNELGTSVLSAHVFEVLAYVPALPIGVQVRVEGSGAVRAIPRVRLHGPAAHCSDGVRNKDETGIDCGGSCSPCVAPTVRRLGWDWTYHPDPAGYTRVTRRQPSYYLPSANLSSPGLYNWDYRSATLTLYRYDGSSPFVDYVRSLGIGFEGSSYGQTDWLKVVSAGTGSCVRPGGPCWELEWTGSNSPPPREVYEVPGDPDGSNYLYNSLRSVSGPSLIGYVWQDASNYDEIGWVILSRYDEATEAPIRVFQVR